MPKPPKATLAGIPITADEPISWRFTQGVQAYFQSFTFANDDAKAVLNKSKAGSGFPVDVTLKVEPDGDPALVVNNLSVISVAPSRAPYLTSIVVADRRWSWNRIHMVKRYNVRRRTGEKRIVDPSVDIAAFFPVNDVQYAKFSLYQENQPWTPSLVLKDVLGNVTYQNFTPGKVVLESLDSLPVEGLELDDSGENCVARVLALFPNLTLFMNKDGVAELTVKSSGAELAEIAASGPPIAGPTLAVQVGLERTRPKAIEVYFTPEDEVRFDFHETDTPTTTSATDESRTLENVMPLPDPILNIAGENYVQGTWVPINQDLFNAWDLNAIPSVIFQGNTIAFSKVDADFIQKQWLTGGYLGIFEKLNQSDPVWERRWAALKQHYRQTFRINRRWADRIRSFRAYRVAIVDPTTGTNAPANVYTNYTRIPTRRRIAKSASDPQARLGIPVVGYDALLANAKICPHAIVDMLDEDNGIFHISVVKDAAAQFDSFIPSNTTSRRNPGGQLPGFNPGNAGLLSSILMKDLVLTSTHDLAIVLTVVTASPNSLSQLYKVVVTPEDAKAVLPKSIASRIGTCNGPTWQIRVGAGTSTARFAWLDNYSDQITNAIVPTLPVDQNSQKPQKAKDDTRVDALLVDPDWIGSIAKAAAASVYASLIDHVEGASVTGWDPARSPVGRVREVVHELTRSGKMITRMDLPPDLAPVDIFSLIPESVRRKILGLVQP